MMLRPLSDKKLRQFLKDADSRIEKLSADVIKRLEKFFTDYITRTKAMLADISTSKTEIIRLSEATEMAQNLDAILAEAGYKEVRATYRRSFAHVARESLRYFSEMGVSKPQVGIDGDVLNALRSGFVRDLDLRVHSKLVQPLREKIIQSTISLGGNRRNVIADIARSINNEGILRRDGRRFYDFNTSVMVNDAHRRFNRSVRTQKADQLGLEIYTYRGPRDNKRRDACAIIQDSAPHGVPGVYYRDEIKAEMHKDLKSNPMVSGGGFNCRHQFMPITKERAKELGFQFRDGDSGEDAETGEVLAA